MFLTLSRCSADMEKPKIAGRNMLPGKKAKGITLNQDATTSRANTTKLPTTGGKGKVKRKAPTSLEVNSDTDNIYATHLTTCESEGENKEHQFVASEDDKLVAT